MPTKQAFTLIELLIVIAVIGLLSAIVLVNVTNTREEARMAAGLQFSSNLKHSLGAYLVGEWSFDNNDARDDSGNGNDGTVNGAIPVDGIIGRAMQFDGNDYITVSDDPSLDITDQITIEFWVKPTNPAPSSYQNMVNKDTWWGPLSVILERAFNVGFSMSHSYAESRRVWGGLTHVNRWHHIVMTGNTSYVRGYIDGTQVAENTNDIASIGTTDTPLCIGRQGTGGYYFQGIIDEVRVYNRALSSVGI